MSRIILLASLALAMMVGLLGNAEAAKHYIDPRWERINLPVAVSVVQQYGGKREKPEVLPIGTKVYVEAFPNVERNGRHGKLVIVRRKADCMNIMIAGWYFVALTPTGEECDYEVVTEAEAKVIIKYIIGEKGEKGEKGDQGEPGRNGEDGESGLLWSGERSHEARAMNRGGVFRSGRTVAAGYANYLRKLRRAQTPPTPTSGKPGPGPFNGLPGPSPLDALGSGNPSGHLGTPVTQGLPPSSGGPMKDPRDQGAEIPPPSGPVTPPTPGQTNPTGGTGNPSGGPSNPPK